MTDRELLELAAKAAGLKFNGQWHDAQSGLLVWEPPDFMSRDWNPLTDDGDALRLAVKLGMQVDVCRNTTDALVENRSCASEPHGADPNGATRRAIVRAAAAIGETP